MMRAPALLLLALASTASATEIEVGYGHEYLTHDYASWNTAYIEADWKRADRAAAGLVVRELGRYGQRDLELGTSATLPIGRRWDISAELGGSPTHSVVASWKGGLQLQCVLGGGFVALSGLHVSRFENEAQISVPVVGRGGLDWYWGSHRLAWTGFLATLAGAWSGSQRAAWDIFYREGDRIGAAVAVGRELESLGAGRLLATDVISAMVAGRNGIGRGWSVTYVLGVQRQGDLYLRAGATLGLRRHF